MINWAFISNIPTVVTFLSWIRKDIKRVSFDILSLLLVFIIALLLPPWLFPTDAKMGFISLFLVKFFSVSAGILHAHISRKLLFPYINFSKEENWSNNLMVIAWYITIIISWARGG